MRKNRLSFSPRLGIWLTAGLTLFGGLARAQTYTDLHDFGTTLSNGNSDGANPQGDIVFDSAGNAYGTTTLGGGALNGGVVWEVTAGGAYRVLHYFGGYNGELPQDGKLPVGAVALDSNGNLWGGTINGGSGGSGGVLFEITSPNSANPVYSVQYNFLSAGLSECQGVLVDSAGNVFGQTYFGGANNLGAIWKFNSSGITVLHSFGTTPGDSGYPQSNVILDANGNLYGESSGNGPSSSNGAVWKIANAAAAFPTFSVLHSFSGSDGRFPGGQGAPVFDGSGNMYGVAYNGGTNGQGVIWKISSAGVFSVLYNFPGGSSGWPTGSVVLDSGGNLYGTTLGVQGQPGILWKFSPTGTLTTLHTFGGTLPNANPDGSGPQGIKLYQGNFYINSFFGGQTGNGMFSTFTLPPPASVTLTTSRDPNPALAGGVGVSFTATVTTNATFAGGAVTLSSGDGVHLQVNGATSKSSPLPAGAGTATFTITAPVDVANDTPVVLTATAPGVTAVTETVTVKPFVQGLVGLSAGVKSGAVQSAYVSVYELPATKQNIAISTSTVGEVFSRMNVSVPAASGGGPAQSAPFSVHCVFVDADTAASMTATHASISSSTAPFTILGPKLTMIVLSPSSSTDPTTSAITYGQSVTVYAVLDSPRNTAYSLQVGINNSTSTNVQGPISVKIGAGQSVSSGTKLTPMEVGSLTLVPMGTPYGTSSAQASLTVTLPAIVSSSINVNVPAAPANAVGGDFINMSVVIPGVNKEQLTCVFSTDNPALVPSFVAQGTGYSNGNLTFKTRAYTSVVTAGATCNVFVQFVDGNGNLIGTPTQIGTATVIPLLKSLTPASGTSFTLTGGKSQTVGTITLWESYPSSYTPSTPPININVTLASSDPSVYFTVAGLPDSTVETLNLTHRTSANISISTMSRLWFMGNGTSTVSIFRPLGMPTSTFTVITTP